MTTPLHVLVAEAATRVEAAFPDRPVLCVDLYQQSNGLWCAYVGKATQMRRMPGKGQPSLEAIEAATIAYLRAQD